jgi:hypothetical protein
MQYGLLRISNVELVLMKLPIAPEHGYVSNVLRSRVTQRSCRRPSQDQQVAVKEFEKRKSAEVAVTRLMMRERRDES